MTDAIKQAVETAGFFAEQEIRTFGFDIRQSTSLHKFAEELAAIGGPQAPGAKSKASLAANELKFSFSKAQREMLDAYSNGLVCVLIFEGLRKISNASPPNELPDLTSMENRYDVLCLAARNQILLKLVDNRAFAYDMDNEGKLVRLVANFKGGGLNRINAEPKIKELSSHSGLALGPHTEAPYWRPALSRCHKRQQTGPCSHLWTFEIFFPYRYFREPFTTAGLIFYVLSRLNDQPRNRAG